jgi:Zn-dependent peptidase ImmA (M78 family)/DNA-binding XRE family transcriptional regulator
MRNPIIGPRIRALRDRQNMTQEDLAGLMGFEDRQTISAIEGGKRALSADELIKMVDLFDVDFDFFTDPFLLVGEARFSWRQHSVKLEHLNQFEEEAGRWIATYRELSRKRGDDTPVFFPRLALDERSSFEDAVASGERVAKSLDLGLIPTATLSSKIEDSFSTLVLHIDAIQGISGAACVLPELNAILINRREPAPRRNYDLAHELFHILTWDAMAPEHVEDTDRLSRRRVEQLAENFAAGLLMPLEALAPHMEARIDGDIHLWLNQTATILGVSAIALKWRMKNAGLIKAHELAGIEDARLRHNGQAAVDIQEAPKLFSRKFLDMLGWGTRNGHISVRKTAGLLNMTIDDLASLFRNYGIQPGFGV